MSIEQGFVAVIDPNWDADAGGGGRGAQNHYDLSGVDGIARGYLDARKPDGVRLWPDIGGRVYPRLVFMWATVGALAQKPSGDPPDAYVLARLLGIRICAQTVWAKIDRVEIAEDITGRVFPKRDRPTMHGVFTRPAQMGIGQWTRCEHETLLICRRGDIAVPPPEVRPRSVIYAPRGVHSAKPEEAWQQVIEPLAAACMPGAPRIEFNARTQRRGWAAYGALDGEKQPLRYAPADPLGPWIPMGDQVRRDAD